MKKILLSFSVLMLVLAASCTEDPVTPDEPNIPVNDTSLVAYIINEGVWGSNNASISAMYLDTTGYILDRNFYKKDNGIIGDVANDAKLAGDTLFVLLNGSEALVGISTETAEIIWEYDFEVNSVPRNFLIEGDKIYATLQASDKVIEIDRATATVTEEYTTGPGPEGLAYHNGMLYVANSAQGQLRVDEENANTTSVINTADKSSSFIDIGPNHLQLYINEQTDKLYATYQNFWWDTENPDYPNIMGGIVEIDLNTNTKTKEWPTVPFDVSPDWANSALYIVTQQGVEKIDLSSTSEPEMILSNGENIWYRVNVNPAGNQLWVTDAANYSPDGILAIYDMNSSSIVESFLPGFLPTRVIFK
jgi:YVTN family beta-propeller protein